MEGEKERGGREQRRETQRRRGKVRGACNQTVQCHRMQRLGCGGDLVVCWKTQSLFQPPRLKTAAAKILTPLSDSSVDEEHTPSHTVHGYLRTHTITYGTWLPQNAHHHIPYMATSECTPSHTVNGYLRTHTITYGTWLPQNAHHHILYMATSERTPSHTVHGYLRTCRQYLRAIKVLVLSLLHD